MSAELDTLRDELIFKAGYLGESVGLGKSMGQLYAALYISDRPMSLGELAGLCRMSKGNASINMRRLEKWGAVKKIWGNGGRRDYYEANRDILGFVSKHGMEVFSDLMNRGEQIFTETKDKVGSIDPAGLDEDKRAAIAAYKKSLGELEGLTKKVKGFARTLENIVNLKKGL